MFSEHTHTYVMNTNMLSNVVIKFSFYLLFFFFYQIAEKERELGVAQGEIKSLRATEALKDKAVEEVLNKIC